ncbi:MAG: type I pullulanase [Oscillospiraceae bacterium]|nr:type I pullulanase [Oscillospiraceae bacterium]
MKKHFLTRPIAMLLALVLALGTCVCPAMATEADDGVVIKLHYNRPDGVYTDWSVWFWNAGAEGTDIPFAEEDGETVATYEVAPGVTSVGFIVKLPNWAAKDVDMDQFIDVAAYVSGTVHVYVESGVEGYETVLGDDVVSGIKVKENAYKEGVGIRVAMTAAISDAAEAFTVTGPEGPLSIASVANDGNNIYTIVTEEALDLYASYTLTYGGEEYPVKMPNVYSTEAFEGEFTYEGDDLGAAWTAEKTSFRLWAPTAAAVKVNLYEGGTAGEDDLIEQLEMTQDVNGTWVASKDGDLNGTYYTYLVDVDGETVEACDPYARTTGVNGQRAMVIDLDSTDPEGWENDTDPHAGQNITDAVIYELHVRDLSVDESSGIENKGKFLGLIETGTTNSEGVSTGLDHIKNLGVTHIHLLPSYDYASVDESKLDVAQFNWGYDPLNYNVPEGSYSTDPYNGEVRVAEMKQMVKGLHDNGISVVMDVVYNHVYSAESFCFNQIVPMYFSRVSDSGVLSSGSGCGNDTASERSMVKKYIVDSVKHWADEYHIDGFRFDLVGLIDTETINEVIEEVHKTHPNVIFYGEGWTMSTEVTKEGYTMTTQANSTETPEFAFFSDTIRDAIKGSVFNNSETGYVSGSGAFAGNIKDCFLGAATWCKSPSQTINYASCHDNMSLYDRLTQSTPEATVEDRIKMNNLAAAIYMTSQGVPFMQAGEEMLRSKPLEDGTFDHNSYASPDSVNNLKWDDLNDEAYQDVYNYYAGLIAFRKAHPALRMTSAEEVAEHITALADLDFSVNAFHITGGANGEDNDLVVVFNPRTEATTVALPEGEWTIYINGEDAGTEALGTAQGEVSVDAISAMVLVKESAPVEEEAPAEEETPAAESEEPVQEAVPAGPSAGVIAAAAAAVVAIAAVVVAVVKKRKK